MKPVLGISMGDPTGVGPEVLVRALVPFFSSPAIQALSEVVVFGDRNVLQRHAEAASVSLPGGLRIEAVTDLSSTESVPGRPNPAAAAAQVAYLEAACEAIEQKQVQALCTAPISKDWAARAGFSFPGHTEYLASRANVDEFAMMMAGPRLKTTVVTRHIALRDVPDALSAEGIVNAIALTALSLKEDFGFLAARVALAGLNPHAGDGGRFGDEETVLLLPALRAARLRLAAMDIDATIEGPVAPDTVFNQALAGRFEAVIALYHDQGLIPAKLLDFDRTVNVTLGLPFVRTSPDHGTAYDIAGKGLARSDSMLCALQLAAEMTARRQKNARSA